jgi:hypothetical protein
MKLPGGDNAIIEIAKIRDYCLNPEHLRGKHKARVFKSALGMTAEDAEELLAVLVLAAREGETEIGASDLFGNRYIIDFELRREERSATIRSCWIVRNDEKVARFVTCYVL